MSKVKKWAVAISIAIVFNLFVNYGVATFYPEPEYSDYCNEPARAIPLKEAANCAEINVSQEMQEKCGEKKGYLAYRYDSAGCATEAYCETCNMEYDKVRKRYSGNIFVALLIAAVIALAAGVLVKKEAVSTGFLLAGLLGLIISATRYWTHLQDIYRFTLLGIVLATLVWLGYKKAK